MTDNNFTPIKPKRIQHRMRKSPEYRTWANMKSRCYNPNDNSYKFYGARGIQVCDRWLNDFTAFYSDMGEKPSPKHSIDRIDNDKNYEPSNCRWATLEEQHRNRRNTHWFTYKGETLSITEWADKIGMKRSTLKRRLLKYGMPIEKAIEQPLKPQWHKKRKKLTSSS